METLHTPELWHEGPNQAADAVIISADNRILLIQRQTGEWALPGGFVNPGEDTSDTARREAWEETGITLTTEGIPCYRGRVEDPRNSEDRWIESDAYYYFADHEQQPTASDDARNARWWEFYEMPEGLYGSHAIMIGNALALKETLDQPA